MLIRSAFASLVFALSAAGVALGAEPKGPCVADTKKFCHDVQPGESRIYRCLMNRQANLAPACRDRMKSTNDKLDRLAKACNSDVGKYCKDVPPGNGHMLSCLKGQGSNLDKGCARELRRARNDRSLAR